MKGTTYQATKDRILSAVHDRDWIAFAGPIGSGKTVTVYSAIEEVSRDKKTEVIEVLCADRIGIKISHIMNSIIYQLGEQFDGSISPRRDMEARTMQVLNILSAARKAGHHIVMTIDEAHELHGNTLKAIKRLRDFRFKGEKNLITIVMIGQPGLTAKLNRDEEVGLRCRNYQFGYTSAELVDIARHHSFDMLGEEETRKVAKAYGTPLAIKHGIMAAMDKAYRIGSENIALKHFDFPKQPEAPKREPRAKISIHGNEGTITDEKIKKTAS